MSGGFRILCSRIVPGVGMPGGREPGFLYSGDCARGGNRTRTRFFGEQDFKSCVSTYSTTRASDRKKIHPETSGWIMLSGRRDSNPRPSPWQGDALPAELLPHLYKNLKRSAKITNTWDWQKKITCIWEYSSCFQALLLLVFLYNAWNTAHNSRPKEMQ